MAPKKKRGKQPDLPAIEGPGVAPVKNPTLERLADDWIEAKDRFETVKEETNAAKESLCSQMRSTNTLTYRYDGHLIQLEPGKDKLTVKDVTDPEFTDTE